MTKKDISELKRRFKKEECTFTKLRGCYVDAQKNILLDINETFLNIEEEEFFKYLEIAKKAVSGTIGNNLLELSFLAENDETINKQNFLLGLKDSKLKNDALLERFYELVIENYEYAGNYLILIFHDAYDVPTKTTDNQKLDESEEVYEYLLCAICPVELSKAGLGYCKDTNRIGARVRDWIVSPPETGFVFPAFSERSSDIHSVLYYAKDAKSPRTKFMEFGLGCKPKRTAVEEKKTFQSIVQNALSTDEEETSHIMIEIQQSLNNMVEEHQESYEREPVILTSSAIQTVLAESGVSEESAAIIEKFYTEEFGDTPPLAENLIDRKAIAENEKRKKEQELQNKVRILTERLEEAAPIPQPEEENESIPQENTEIKNTALEGYDIVVQVKPEKLSQIKSQIVDGQKCIIIPIDSHEQTAINGVETEI